MCQTVEIRTTIYDKHRHWKKTYHWCNTILYTLFYVLQPSFLKVMSAVRKDSFQLGFKSSHPFLCLKYVLALFYSMWYYRGSLVLYKIVPQPPRFFASLWEKWRNTPVNHWDRWVARERSFSHEFHIRIYPSAYQDERVLLSGYNFSWFSSYMLLAQYRIMYCCGWYFYFVRVLLWKTQPFMTILLKI